MTNTIVALAATAMAANAATVAISNGDFEDSAQNAPYLGWTDEAGNTRAWTNGLGTNTVVIHQGGTGGNVSVFTIQNELAETIKADTTYTLDYLWGTGSSSATGTGVWTSELGTLNAGVWTSLATSTETVTDAGNSLFWGSGGAAASPDAGQLVFTTGDTVSGDSLAIRASIDGGTQWMGVDAFALDATEIPEPSSTALLGLGGLALILLRRK